MEVGIGRRASAKEVKVEHSVGQKPNHHHHHLHLHWSWSFVPFHWSFCMISDMHQYQYSIFPNTIWPLSLLPNFGSDFFITRVVCCRKVWNWKTGWNRAKKEWFLLKEKAGNQDWWEQIIDPSPTHSSSESKSAICHSSSSSSYVFCSSCSFTTILCSLHFESGSSRFAPLVSSVKLSKSNCRHLIRRLHITAVLASGMWPQHSGFAEKSWIFGRWRLNLTRFCKLPTNPCLLSGGKRPPISLHTVLHLCYLTLPFNLFYWHSNNPLFLCNIF